MNVNVNLQPELVKRVDERAKAMFLSRSAYISLALAHQLQSEEIADKLRENVTEAMEQDAKK